MDRRIFNISLLSGGLSAALSGCASTTPLRVGIHPRLGHETLALAKDFGWLPEQVVLSVAESASESMEGLHRGWLDAAALTLDEVLALNCNGLDLAVVLVMSKSVGSDQVLARRGFEPSGLKRPIRVGVESMAAGRVVFMQWMQHLNLPLEAFELIDLPPSRHIQAWDIHEIDVSISYPPHSQHLARRHGVVIYDSRSFTDLILDVLAVRTDRTGWRDHTMLHELVQAHFRGRYHLRQNPEDAMRRIASWQELDYREVLMGFAGINQPDAARNRKALQDGGGVSEAANRLDPILRQAGLLSRPCHLSKLLNPEFIP